jgi:hypothetical protein
MELSLNNQQVVKCCLRIEERAEVDKTLKEQIIACQVADHSNQEDSSKLCLQESRGQLAQL